MTTKPDIDIPELQTILDVVRFATTRFSQERLTFGQGSADALEDAMFLSCGALDLPPDSFEKFLRARIVSDERRRMLELVDARVKTRKPTAYLIQRAYMQGLSFYVDERAIIPRSFLGELLNGPLFGGDAPALVPNAESITSILDLCTGSACIAILACRAFPNATVDAVDISSAALEVASKNVSMYRLEDRIRLHLGDLYEPLGSSRYDLILTNPPYVTTEAMAALPTEFKHEPSLALDGGNDGMEIAARVLEDAGRHLNPGGGLLCEVGSGRSELVKRYPHTEFLWLDTAETHSEVFWLSENDISI